MKELPRSHWGMFTEIIPQNLCEVQTLFYNILHMFYSFWWKLCKIVKDVTLCKAYGFCSVFSTLNAKKTNFTMPALSLCKTTAPKYVNDIVKWTAMYVPFQWLSIQTQFLPAGLTSLVSQHHMCSLFINYFQSIGPLGRCFL